eukprot:1177289-Prorocentrum_minimum.AAC.1
MDIQVQQPWWVRYLASVFQWLTKPVVHEVEVHIHVGSAQCVVPVGTLALPPSAPLNSLILFAPTAFGGGGVHNIIK